MRLKDAIAFSRGEKKADLLLKEALLVNVLSGRIELRDIAIAQGMVVGFGEYPAREVMSLEKRFLVPGFIDAHVHIESSMVGGEGICQGRHPPRRDNNRDGLS